MCVPALSNVYNFQQILKVAHNNVKKFRFEHGQMSWLSLVDSSVLS